MKPLFVLIVVLCGVSLAKHIVNPLAEETLADVYNLCANPGARCISENNNTCIETKNCENLVVIEADEDAGFTYHMMTTGHQYISIGFSNDKSMGAEMCISCLDIDGNGTITGELSHNVGRKNFVEDSQDELIVSSTKKEDTTMYCKFTLNDTLSFARKIDNSSDSRYYVVGVSGKLKDGKVGHHGGAFIPEEMWSFGPSVGTESFYDLCEKDDSVKCVGAWSKSEAEAGACLASRNCTKAYAMESSEDGHTFHLFGVDVAYMSIGFSQDQKMGSDAVIACVQNGTSVNGILSRNEDYKNIQAASNEGLTMTDAKLEDGTIYCSFTLDNVVEYARTLEEGNTETEFYIIGAGGSVNDDGSLGHHAGHLMSEEKWAFTSSAATITSSLLLAILATLINLRS